MNLTAMKNLVTSKSALQVLKLRKHAPVILFAAGTVGVVVTVVLACKSTLKLEETLEEGDRKRAKIEMNTDPDYSEMDRKKDLTVNYFKTAGSVAKLYAAPVLVGAASIGALTGAHVVLSRRNIALTAAYAALDKAHRKYRERVLKELGPEQDAKFQHGLIDKEYIEETATGPAVKRGIGTPPDEPSQYARFFDESCEPWKRERWMNANFIKMQEQYANDRLHAYGYLFLNTVYESLGLPPTPAGQIVGWVLNGGDNYVDFGVFRNGTDIATEFINGHENSILLDFNVDGPIWDKI